MSDSVAWTFSFDRHLFFMIYLMCLKELVLREAYYAEEEKIFLRHDVPIAILKIVFLAVRLLSYF